SLFFEWRTPTGWDWLYLFLVGVFSQLGQVFLTNALQKERVAGVAIINYTGLVYADAIGWYVFGEMQTVTSMFGMLLVVFGVLLSVIYSNRKQALESIESTAA
ncbi:MAG: EamA family transporter, partial [Solirubrobacterales bacterium]|nr:EamA family transporter [Solirubrobacterales bacterium]